MMVRCSSGRCAMRADLRADLRTALRGALLALALACTGVPVLAAEAPVPESGDFLGPLPPEAEAAHQDLRGKSGARRQGAGKPLDEAIFTEISPLTIPEIGVALPADQEH